MTCYGNLSLDRTRFLGPAPLQDVECLGGFWCNRTLFATRADIRGMEVHGRTWIVGAAFAGQPASGSHRLAGTIRGCGYLWS